jgi:hypothetical protein
MDKKLKLLFHLPPHLTTPGKSFYLFNDFIIFIQDKLDLYIEDP